MKRVTVFILGLVASLIVVESVSAQERVELSMSKTEVEVGEAFEAGVTISQLGSGSLNISLQQIPGMENFQVSGTSTSSRVQVVNGVSTAISSTVYTLSARDEGTFMLGPVVVDGVESNSVTVTASGYAQGNLLPGISGNQFLGINEEKTTDNSAQESESSINAMELILGLVVVIMGGLLVVVWWLFGRGGGGKEGGGLSTFQNFTSSGSARDDAIDLNSVSIASIEDENYSADKVRQMMVKWMEQETGKKLRHMSTQEILEELKGSNDGKILAAMGVLQTCDQAIYAKEPVNSQKLIEEYRQIVS